MAHLSFTKLHIWREAYDLSLLVYKISRYFPDYEKFGLTSQVRRSSVSVAANIAEGDGRPSNADKCRFFGIAQGSAQETAMHILLSRDLGFIEIKQADELIKRYTGLLAGISTLVRHLKKMT
ncbi:MAG: four helix bundle protein [Patescibacteria group bacterium]|nr:four helix bundle protein [Patescibacteria group bacterium]